MHLNWNLVWKSGKKASWVMLIKWNSMCVTVCVSTPMHQLTCFLKTDCLPVQYVILPHFYFYRWCIRWWLPLCLHSWLGFVALMFGWKITVGPGTVNNNVVPFCLSLFIKPFTASWFWIYGEGKKNFHLTFKLTFHIIYNSVEVECSEGTRASVSMDVSALWY